ncbi:MAG: PAS domain S-box protein [Candidatus Hydrogenedentes bacterium]|nr:PAS domain S-box protein [Candidatus Hydrogenedentota bacterium]
MNSIASTNAPSAQGLTPFGQDADIRALADAFEIFTRTTQTMEESYRRLEARLQELDRELESKNRELAITTDYLSSIMESMSDGVIAVDTLGIVTTFNTAASRVLGYDARDAVGQPFIDVFGREFAVPSGRHGRELRAEDGRAVRVSECDSPLFDRSLRRIGTVKVFQDQTEIESLRTRLQHQDRLAAIGQMAATVAHEIRNPLGGIRGFAALLARDIVDEDPRARLVEKILAGAKALERVVTDLLEFTRPLQLRRQSVPLRELVTSALSYVDRGARTLSIENAVSGSVHVAGDPDKLRQVLLNLLLNAVQSIQQDGQIRIESALVDGWIELRVIDDGCGMTPRQLEQIFSPFFTTKEKGTGLGLAIALKIVEAHGGRVAATSAPGAGSTFTIALPRAE